jgi:hypothetical protein
VPVQARRGHPELVRVGPGRRADRVVHEHRRGAHPHASGVDR